MVVVVLIAIIMIAMRLLHFHENDYRHGQGFQVHVVRIFTLFNEAEGSKPSVFKAFGFRKFLQTICTINFAVAIPSICLSSLVAS